MRYEPNYSRQYFSESDSIPSPIELASSINVNGSFNKMPKDRFTSAVHAMIGIGALVLAVVAVIIYVVTKSPLLTLVMSMAAVFFIMGILAFVGLALSRTKFAKSYTETVPAKCIGISIRGVTDHMRLIKTPVFKYAYGGKDYIAIDGKWANFHDAFPEIGGDWEIEVNPDDPEDIRWQQGRSTAKFVIIWGIASIIFASGMLWLCFQDEDFMKAARADNHIRIEQVADIDR